MSILRQIDIRPGVMGSAYWNPSRPRRVAWDRIRDIVLERDQFTCQGCGHIARKSMTIHHVVDSGDHSLENLATLCAACHAILHIGHSLMHRTVQIWLSDFDQVELIQLTRAGVAEGYDLQLIHDSFPLSLGPFSPTSLRYANQLVWSMGDRSRASLASPLCAIFTNFRTWQLDA